ncbi:hypothetical protein P3W45_001634 [Vairimorpha bombi]
MISFNNKIISILNKNMPHIQDRILYTHHNNTIYSTNLDTHLVDHIITSDKISDFCIQDGNLYYYSTEVYRYNLSTKSVYRFDCNKKDMFIKNILVISDTDIVVFYENDEIYLVNESVSLLYKHKSISSLIKDSSVFFSDTENVFSIDISSKEVSKIYSGESIIKIGLVDDNLVIITRSNIILNKSIINYDTSFVDIIDHYIYLHTCLEDSHKSSILDCRTGKISPLNNNLRMLTRNIGYDEMFRIYQDNTDLVLISNIEEVLEVKEINNMIIFSSGNKLIILSNSESSNKDDNTNKDTTICCMGRILEYHDDTILSISHNNEYLISTSKDSTSIIFKIEENELIFNKRLSTGVMNSIDIKEDVCVIGGDDGLVCIFNISEVLNETRIDDAITDKMIIQKVNDKDINSVCISKSKELIFLGCSDKIIKILNFNLEVIKVLKDHKKSVMSVYSGIKYFITGSSDKSIRIYNYDYECVSVLTGHESGVLCTKLYDNDKKLVSSSVGGLIKIWDVSKGVCTDNFDVGGDVWSIEILKKEEENQKDINLSDLFYLVMGTTDTIISYSTYKDNTSKNNTIHIKNKEYDKVVTNNIKLIYFILKESEENREKMFNKYKNKIYEIILECGRFKDIEFVNELVEFCIRKRMYDKNVIGDMKKYICMVDDMYGDLVGAENIFKS